MDRPQRPQRGQNPVQNNPQGNNGYNQQMQGQSAGVKSYGLVVDLAVSYYKQEKSPDE